MQINGLKADNFEIKVINQNNQIKIQWFGRSEARNPAKLLNPYFENMLSKLKDKQVAIDYTELEFMNSSTVPPIIKFIKSCSQSASSIVVNYNMNLEWQTASFKPIQTVCLVLKNVTVAGI